MKALRLYLVACLILAAASCSLKASWDLPGNWQQIEGKDTIVFNQNGTMVLTSGATTLSAAYKYIDAKELKIELGLLGTTSIKASVDHDILTLTDSSGKVTKFKKAK